MLAASLILCPAVFSGCSAKTENVKNTNAGSQDPISATAIKLNTAVTVTIYDSQDRELLTECMNLCDKYEKIFSRTGTYTCEGDRGYLSGVGFSGGAGF